ncbi:hypothetical protein VNO80_29323 [Phaseolus coccineus]|uniref:Uncharacterized protein n=1 Tax=Phaseolus coccineus TaxID=3886 RepID=A0AAN9QCB2_PHACN
MEGVLYLSFSRSYQIFASATFPPSSLLLLPLLLNPRKGHYHISTLPPPPLLLSPNVFCHLGILQLPLLSANSASYAPRFLCYYPLWCVRFEGLP